jgi:hypothetical protein
MVIVDLRVVAIADDTEGAEWHRHLVGIRIDKGGLPSGRPERRRVVECKVLRAAS